MRRITYDKRAMRRPGPQQVRSAEKRESQTHAELAGASVVELQQSERVAKDIRAALRRFGYANLQNVQCTVIGGDVLLSGTLHSFHMKQLAQTAVMKTAGVKSVRNIIDVRYDETTASDNCRSNNQ